MAEEGIVRNAKRVGDDVLGPGLADLAARHDVVGEVRGTGVFWAIELVSDRAKRTPLSDASIGELRSRMIGNGLIPFTSQNRIHVVPPAVITPTEAATGLSIIDDALTRL
jgi:taurine--2-oxoglutarate transaminase